MAETGDGGERRLNMTPTPIQPPADAEARFTVNPARVASTAATDALMRFLLEKLAGEFEEVKGRINGHGSLSMAGDLVHDILWTRVQRVFAEHGIRIEE